MSREKKGVEHLSENDDIRRVKKHFHRFSKFLRYLQENNATITIEEENKDGKVKIEYTSKANKDAPKIRGLVEDVLGINSDQVRDYYRTKLGLDDKHSNLDRIRKEFGDLLYGIKVQVKGSENRDIIFKPLSNICFQKFHSKNAIKAEKFDLQKISSNNPSLSIHKRIKYALDFEVNHGVDLFMRADQIVPLHSNVNYLKKQGEELNHFIEENESSEFENKLKGQTLKLVRMYNQILRTYNSETHILPYYLDFSILGEHEICEKSITLYADQTFEDFKHAKSYLGTHNLIYFRYEIMEQLLNEKKSPVEWSIKHQALLVLCIIEINTVPKIITEILKNVMRSVRFTAFHKFSNSDNSVQIDNLTFDDLRYILLKYHIPDDPEKVFQLKKNNILFEPLHKYPDYHAVNQTYNSDEIQHIESLVAVFIKKKIMEDLNLSESILPELDANSKIVLWNY